MQGQKHVSTGRIGRSGVVGLAAARAGVYKVGHLTRRPFLSKERRAEADAKNDAEIARVLFEGLCILRGTALKAAQLAATEIELVPESYRRELAKAASEVPPMNRALVHKIVKSELGPPASVFRRFEPFPFAAASLGQVHAATAHDGRELAVKVQYPGMVDGVEADIDMVKTLLAATKYRRVFGCCWDEVSRRVKEELDYELEAKHTTMFRERCKVKGIVLPEVVPALSTKSILSTSRLDGLHLDAWLATGPSQSERDRYAQTLVDFFNDCTYDWGLVHADPHPGNYLFGGGQLGVIDFGCVKRLSADFVSDLRELKTTDSRDLSRLASLHERVGIHYRKRGDRAGFARFFRAWVSWLQKPYRHECFDFSASNGYFVRGSKLAPALHHYIDHYEGTSIYYGRAEHGLMRMLERLGARVRMRPTTPS